MILVLFAGVKLSLASEMVRYVGYARVLFMLILSAHIGFQSQFAYQMLLRCASKLVEFASR